MTGPAYHHRGTLYRPDAGQEFAVGNPDCRSVAHLAPLRWPVRSVVRCTHLQTSMYVC